MTRAAVAVAVIALIAALAYFPVGTNAWHLLTGRGFVIPDESSVLAFEPTLMNPGSGEWWLYGRDARFYYHFVGSADTPYLKLSREQAARCAGFSPHDVGSWCLDGTRP